MSQAEFKKRLKALMNKPENQVCSDCPERQPRWASLIVPPPGSPPGSLPIGAFCCLECSGSHRRLGVHISFVRSITLDSWKEKEVLAMENGGNAKVNAIFEAHLNNPAAKPSTGASGSVRERYIRDKYERRKYYDPHVLQNYAQSDSASDSSSSSSGGSPSRSRQPVSVRAPSEAARMRAQARKRTSPKIPSATVASIPKSRSVPLSKAPAPAPPEVDLLDFSAPMPIAGNDASSAPPLQPPSAAPSPTLDMFKNMQDLSINDNSSTSISSNANVTRSATMPVRAGNNLAPQTQMDNKKMTSDDILAMFHTPSQPQQSNFASFGRNNSMNNMNMNNQMNNSMMNANMGNINMMNNNMNMNHGIMNGPMQQRQRQMMAMQMNGMSNSNNGMNMRGSQGQGQSQMNNFNNNNMMPMGGAPSNMNVMGGSGMGMGMGMSNMSMSQNGMNQSYPGNSNSMGMGNMGSSMGNMGGTNNIDRRHGGQHQGNFGNNNVMGGSATQQSNQFASFGSFR